MMRSELARERRPLAGDRSLREQARSYGRAGALRKLRSIQATLAAHPTTTTWLGGQRGQASCAPYYSTGFTPPGIGPAGRRKFSPAPSRRVQSSEVPKLLLSASHRPHIVGVGLVVVADDADVEVDEPSEVRKARVPEVGRRPVDRRLHAGKRIAICRPVASTRLLNLWLFSEIFFMLLLCLVF